MSSNAALFDKLGGEESIKGVVDFFKDLVLSDETVNHFFANTDMKKQRQHLNLSVLLL